MGDSTGELLPGKAIKVFGSAGLREVPAEDVRSITELQKSSDRDYLTGLKKLRAFNKDLASDLSHIDETPFVVVGIDLNELKLYNEVFGYNRGDELIIAAAQSLQRQIPHSDTVYRPHEGGDEFFMILRNMPKKQAEERMRKLVGKLNHDVSKDPFAPTMSIAFMDLDTDTPPEKRTISGIVDDLSTTLHVVKTVAKKEEGSVTYSKEIVGVIRKLQEEGKDISMFFGTQPSILFHHDLVTGETKMIPAIEATPAG